MSNDKAVEDRLGEEFVFKILNHASEGMEDNDLTQIARKLGEMSDPPNKVLGNHKRRMRSKDVRERVEMRAILSDWWNEKLYDLTMEQGRVALIQIFNSTDLVGDGYRNLAVVLRELSTCPNLPSTSQAVPVLPGGATTQEKLEKAVRKAIVKPSDPGKDQSRKKLSQSICVTEFAQNLAYDISQPFGDNFKIWLGEDRNRNKGTETRVKLFCSFINHTIATHRHANGLRCGRTTSEKVPTFPT